MNKTVNSNGKRSPGNEAAVDESKNKTKARGKKRKRKESDSSTDIDDMLPENTLAIERSLQASALKNNLDDTSVKKILKTVVTNDHVLALVKIREEEEVNTERQLLQLKLTRSKFKELKKISPKCADFGKHLENFENLELTPIKHIPVKTRPEVKALIAQELPDEEDDDEYEPTHDDVPSDDDQTLESCSDVDSQPRTPATPSSHTTSPKVVKDGPFKVPQEITPARRKLVLEEEATIARRTRSKLSLSATPIEHIESSFVPPDDIPTPVVDDLWNQFLEECLNPASVSKNEEDDEADPEYNVAADTDAHDEDDLENSIIKISKKELQDLVNEIFNIMPEPISEELAENLANNVLTDNQNEISGHWKGKQEPISDDDSGKKAKRIMSEKRDSTTRFSIGKSESDEPELYIDTTENATERNELSEQAKMKNKKCDEKVQPGEHKKHTTVNITVEEHNLSLDTAPAHQTAPPALLRNIQGTQIERVDIHIDQAVTILPEQILILQQQLRMHIQVATSNYLQLYVNPAHWTLAPTYKSYLEQFAKLLDSNPDTIVNVCNLKPALELIDSWEKSVSDDTPENKKMVEFIQKEVERNRLRRGQNSLYVGEFPETFQKVVANSNVFLYPYLLPSMPYCADTARKFSYRRCEDELIALGLDEFWQYVESNPQIFKPRSQPNPRHRWGLTATVQLVSKHIFPWVSPRWLLGHIHKVRREKDNPIYDFFESRKVTPVKHKLLPFNPKLTLYEQPEHEMPRIWLRYLAKSSKRFRDFMFRRKCSGIAPQGVTVEIGSAVTTPKKNPLPIDFTKTIISNRANVHPKIAPKPLADKFDVQINTQNNISVGTLMPANDKTAPTSIVPAANAIVIPSQNIIASVITPARVIATDAKSNNTAGTGSTFTASTLKNNSSTGNETKGQNAFVVSSNMFQLVQTSTGAFLMPLTIVQTTNSVNTPLVSSTEEKNATIVANNLPGDSNTKTTVIEDKDKENEYAKDHCKCCIMLRKICKEKQSFITDFFKPKNSEIKKCHCVDRRYPKISNRLRLLINNYKSKSWCVHRELQKKLNLKKKSKGKNKDNECWNDDMESMDSSYSLEDIASVTSYQVKLTMRIGIVRNTKIKQRVNNIFSNFDPDVVDPLWLTEELYQAFGVELVDLYKEFLGFLTAEQADKMDKFKDYFLQSCASDLIKKVEEEVPDKGSKSRILTQLNEMMVDNVSTACDMCASLLSTMEGVPHLAKHVFELFPHRVAMNKDIIEDKDRCEKNINTPPSPEKQMSSPLKQTSSPLKQTPSPRTKESSKLLVETKEPAIQEEILTDPELADEDALTIDDTQAFTTMDYEADHSSSGEEDCIADRSVIEKREDSNNILTESNTIKCEDTTQRNVLDTPELTISKTEVQDHCKFTTMSAMVTSEDELDSPVKSEPLEWKRDEDKLILELLLQHITPEQRKDKTIIDVINDKKLPQILAESLTDKSLRDIKERVLYLLEILVFTEY